MRLLAAAICALPLVFGGCTLGSETVEPELPTARINSRSTLAYRADGHPVIAYNDTYGLLNFSGPNVGATWSEDSLLIVYADQSAGPGKLSGLRHDLALHVLRVGAAGEYGASLLPETHYREWRRANGEWQPGPVFQLQPGAAQQLSLRPEAGTIKGRFRLTFQDPASGRVAQLTDGWLDVDQGY